jgi:hypothetical protein
MESVTLRFEDEERGCPSCTKQRPLRPNGSRPKRNRNRRHTSSGAVAKAGMALDLASFAVDGILAYSLTHGSGG